MANPLTFLYNSFRTQLFLAPPPPTTSFPHQTIIVTGGNTGLGLASIIHFVNLNAARIILTSRDLQKGEAALAQIEEATGKTGVVEVWQLDLASARGVDAFVGRVEKEGVRVDVLMCNAGSATEKFSRVGDALEEGTEEGMETVSATNVVGTFRLVVGMLPLLRKQRREEGRMPPRVCLVSSDLHFISGFEQRKSEKIVETLNREDGVGSMFERYTISKLIEVLLVRHLAKILPLATPSTTTPPIIISSINPGLVDTDLAREQGKFGAVFKWVFRAWTPEVGSRCLVYAAAMGAESHGRHVSNGVLAEPSPFAKSEEGEQVAAKIWGELLELYGVKETDVLAK